MLEYFLEELSKFADCLVEDREELVGLKSQVFCHVVDGLELEAHSNQ